MIVIDTEIKNMIPDKHKPRLPNVEYCEGWGNFRGMGLAIACVFDYDTKTKYSFWDCDLSIIPPDAQGRTDYVNAGLDDLRALIAQTDYIIGYNTHTFDNKLLAAFDIVVPPERSYDIYPQIIEAAGLSRQPFWAWKGHKLGDVARANSFPDKTGDGADAPLLWQAGKYAELRDYCMHDVRLTKGILDRIISGTLLSPINYQPLTIPTPDKILGPVQRQLGLK